MDELHAALATIDENLVRQELTILERSEQLSRKKEIYEALHAETKRGNGPGRGRREKKRNKFGSSGIFVETNLEEWENGLLEC